MAVVEEWAEEVEAEVAGAGDVRYIAVISGKGGTGKTLVSTSLAYTASAKRPTVLADLDTEEPNGHLFFDIKWLGEEQVFMDIPQVNLDVCTRCGECMRACQKGAIVVGKKTVMVFESLCHGCMLCQYVCPVPGAIEPKKKRIGVVRWGHVRDAGELDYYMGLMDIGVLSSTPIVRRVRKRLPKDRLVIADGAPGASCPVVEAVRGADFAILVTEPTPFGLHDLKVAYELVEEFGIPSGVVINRWEEGGFEPLDEFLRQKGIPVLARIPFSEDVARVYASGRLPVREIDWVAEIFEEIYGKVVGGV